MHKSGFVISSVVFVISSVVEKSLFALLLVLLLWGCGPRRGATGPSSRSFPRVDVPSLYTDADARLQWTAKHYWDKYLDVHVSTWAADSLNGVLPEELEREMGTYTTLLGMLPVPEGKVAVERYYSSLEDFAVAFPQTAVFRNLVRLTEDYLKDPNSPVRNDDLYQSFAKCLSESALTPRELAERYAWEARVFDLNRVGSKAADFNFIDTKGRRSSLYKTQAEFLVLIFGNPDCTACRELMENMSAIPSVVELQRGGRLKVMDIYIDEDVPAWRAKADTYPSTWINGYDCDGVIRANLIYHVRAIPSIYLLDASKTVLLKDAPEDRLLDYLGAI